MERARSPLTRLLALFACSFALLALMSSTWFVRKYFGPVSTDQLLFHLQNGGMDYADPKFLSRAGRYLAGTLLLAALCSFALVRRAPRARRAFFALLGLGGALSVWATVQDRCLPGPGDYLAEHYVDPRAAQVELPSSRPDLLIVFVESLDDAYARPAGNGETLVPRIAAWRQAHQSFGELHNLSGASWTVGGMFSALCGLPLQAVGLMGHNAFEQAQQFFAGGYCLTDLLAARGWEISFYGGASLRFAGKGKFLAAHGVSRRFGREQWQARGLEMPRDGWGLLDSALGEQAWIDMNRPRSGDRPRVHILLTVDTHAPSGTADAGCSAAAPSADDGDAQALMRASLRCTDSVVGALVRRFTSQADGRPKVVWIMGDHAGPQRELFTALTHEANDAPRRVFHALARFDAQGRDLPAPTASRQFSHVDVMPTLAEALGLRWRPAHRLGLGSSLLAGSTTPTLIESEGFDRVDRRLACESPLFARLWATAPGVIAAPDDGQ